MLCTCNSLSFYGKDLTKVNRDLNYEVEYTQPNKLPRFPR